MESPMGANFSIGEPGPPGNTPAGAGAEQTVKIIKSN